MAMYSRGPGLFGDRDGWGKGRFFAVSERISVSGMGWAVYSPMAAFQRL
jgi:hypothetical protein